MASTTVKPYPHVQINVKDNSIASVNIVESVPVHRPLYVMRTQEGPLGVPTWCNTYGEAVAKFGEETFNAANATYFSKAAQFLRTTMTNNGAFIVRYLPQGNASAQYVLFARVYEEEAIPQYVTVNGARALVWDGDQWVYQQKEGAEATAPGVSVIFGTRALLAGETIDTLKPKRFAATAYEPAFYEFPLFVFIAKYPGAYGNDLAIRLFYTNKSNNAADIDFYGSVFYNIGFARREYNSTTCNDISDVYGAPHAPFAINPDAVNPDSGASLGIDYVLDKGFSDAAHQLPVDFYLYESSFKAIGNIIAAYESTESLNGFEDVVEPIGHLTDAEKEAVKAYYFGDSEPTDEQKAIVEGLTIGYKVNVLGLTSIGDLPYDHAILRDSSTDFIATSLTDTAYTYLGTASDAAGADGEFVADEDGGTTADPHWSTDDRAMYDFCKLQLPVLKDTIVESLHYPFTHIFDIGFSMKTKKAIIGMLDARDDFMAILSSQVLMSDGSGRAVASDFDALNTQAQDEANVETLRADALLRRESVLYGTDCMRCSIYCHSGILAEGSYTKPVPFTLWSAVQYSQYGNLTYMKAQEPRGLPNSYNLMFKKWNWNNYRADAQSRVWDAGANYVQYADMSRLFYPALRTVYRASTSVLVDEWFVAAVIYAKYVAKHAWATFSGRNDSASILQGSIKQYLDGELAHLFNGKYTFITSVYQTADEQELGYIQHVKMSITSPATMRVLDVDIEVNREGFTPEE